jgi:hypothetical protein
MIKNILFIPSSGSSTLLNNLLAYWKLDETSGTRFDSTANNNDLTDNNTVGSTTGIQGNAADFVPVNVEYFSYPSPVLTTTTFSVSVWVYPKTYGTFGRAIFYQGDVLSDPGIHLWIASTWEGSTNCLGFRYNNAGNSPSNSNSITLNTWQHVVVTYDGNTVRFYVNNVAVGSNVIADSSSPLAKPFYVGVWYEFNDRRIWDGYLDELGIWSRVLTAAERTELYNSGSGITYPFV